MKLHSTILLVLIAVLTGGPTNVQSQTMPAVVTTASGLEYYIQQKGTGPTVKDGDTVWIFETTSYRNGTVLYTNEKKGPPIKILIGGKQVTEATEEGLRGMQAGEIRVLTAPPHLVKRKTYPPNISPDSTLVIRLILDKIE